MEPGTLQEVDYLVAFRGLHVLLRRLDDGTYCLPIAVRQSGDTADTRKARMLRQVESEKPEGRCLCIVGIDTMGEMMFTQPDRDKHRVRLFTGDFVGYERDDFVLVMPKELPATIRSPDKMLIETAVAWRNIFDKNYSDLNKQTGDYLKIRTEPRDQFAD